MTRFNSKYTFVFAIGLFLLGFNCQSLWRWSQKDKVIDEQKAVAEVPGKSSTTDQNLLSYNMMEQMASTGLPIGLDSLLSGRDAKNKLLAKLDSGSLLAVRVSPLSCSMCVDSTIVSVRRFIKKNNLTDRIVILTSYRRERDLVLFHRLNQIETEVFNIKEDEITLPIEEQKKPYMFIMDSNLISKSLFIPEKTNLWLTDLYLNSVKNLYFKK